MRRPLRKAAAAALAAVVLTLSAAGLARAEPSAAPGAGAGRPGDQAAFDRIRDRQAEAWYREDGAAFAATYTADADLVTFNGDHLSTREGIAAGMQYYFDNYIDHSVIRYLDEHVTYAGRDLAVIVRTTCLLDHPGEECRDGSLSVNTNVMVREHGTWLQQSFQNTRKVALP